jgi:hypothetical protein
MTPEKWQNLIGDIKDKFEVEEHNSQHLDEHGGTDIEFIIFKSPLGRIKLEFVTKPLVLEKKTFYSQRIGSETTVEYVYSQDEKTYKLLAYKWDENQNDWVKIDAESFG